MSGMEAFWPRRSQRDIQSPGNYYVAGLVGADTEEYWRTKVRALEAHSVELGFESLFDAIEMGAKSDAGPLGQFVDSGGLERLYLASRKGRKRSQGDPDESRTTRCLPAMDIYRREWSVFHSETSTFKLPLTGFSDDYVNDFSFDGLFDRMAEIAPRLVDLMLLLTAKRTPANDPDSTGLRLRAQKRHIVVGLSVLANHAS
jgi:hypothetical protein